MKAGEDIEVKIEKIDRENKKISLDLAGNDKEASVATNVDDFRGYIGKSPKAMGTLGDVLEKSGKKH